MTMSFYRPQGQYDISEHILSRVTVSSLLPLYNLFTPYLNGCLLFQVYFTQVVKP